MTKEGNASENTRFPKTMYPDNASTSPYIRRLDNREESLLGTFIQWVDHDRARKVEKKSTDNSSRKGPVGDTIVEKDENKLKTNYIKRNRSDTKGNLSEREIFRENVTKLHENVHISRPQTPHTLDKKTKEPDAYSDLDKYRIMYLLVRVEQQREHLRQVLKNMEKMGRTKAEIQNIVNIQGAISKMHGYLIGVRDNDHMVLRQIGTRADLEEFLLTVESACSSIEELPIPGTSDDKMLQMMNHMDNITNKTGAKEAKTQVKLRRRKNTPPNCMDVMLKTLESTDLMKNTWKNPAVKKNINSKNTQQDLEQVRHVQQDKNKTACQIKGKSAEANKTTEKTETNLPKITPHETEETELASLMREIDDLMDDTGLTNGRNDRMLSYEVLMLGAGEKKSNNHVRKRLDGSRASRNSDLFIEELDKLLDECDTT